MTVAVTRRKLRRSPRDIGLLRPELGNHGRAHHVWNRLQIAAAIMHLLRLLVFRPAFRGLSARLHQLGVKFRKLLLVDRELVVAGGGQKIMLAAELGHRLFGLLNLFAQALHPLREPERCALGGVVLGVELINHVGVRDRIGEHRRLFRNLGSDRNRNHVSALHALHLQHPAKADDRAQDVRGNSFAAR